MQGIRTSLQILPIDQFFQLRLLAAQLSFQLIGLPPEVFHCLLQAAFLRGQLVQIALGHGDFLLDPFELIRRTGALPFGGGHFLAQGFNLAAQFLEVILLFADLARRWRCLLHVPGRRGGKALARQQSEQRKKQDEAGRGKREERRGKGEG